MTFPLLATPLLVGKRLEIAWDITPDSTNYGETEWRDDAIAAGWDGVSVVDLRATLAPGGYLGASNTSTAAFDTGATPLPPGSTLTLVVKGKLYGRGGTGGKGADAYPTPENGSAGGSGGPAIIARIPLNVDNADGIIGGGGGGGGGGQAAYRSFNEEQYGGGGAGGGQGVVNSGGGARGESHPTKNPAIKGSGGNIDSYGSGGSGSDDAGNGGRGGLLGQAGQAGGGGTTSFDYGSPGAAGAAGAAVKGIENVTWIHEGDVRGPQISL